MTADRYEKRARFLLADLNNSSDPEGAAQRILEQLERASDAAEVRRINEEAFLARAVELMQRADEAHHMATRAAAARARIDAEHQREKERQRKNARVRARYRERRLTESPRPNKRTGMHAIAIVVDPTAYQALKLEARRRSPPIPSLLGEIVAADLHNASAPPTTGAPRWYRTGDGRRANKHTRIDIEDEAWSALHLDALLRSRTVARHVGLMIERWAAEQDDRHRHANVRE